MKERIISGVYQPGMRLIASDLAAEFNISRMPVREALTRLGSTGLVGADQIRPVENPAV